MLQQQAFKFCVFRRLALNISLWQQTCYKIVLL